MLARVTNSRSNAGEDAERRRDQQEPGTRSIDDHRHARRMGRGTVARDGEDRAPAGRTPRSHGASSRTTDNVGTLNGGAATPTSCRRPTITSTPNAERCAWWTRARCSAHGWCTPGTPTSTPPSPRTSTKTNVGRWMMERLALCLEGMTVSHAGDGKQVLIVVCGMDWLDREWGAGRPQRAAHCEGAMKMGGPDGGNGLAHHRTWRCAHIVQ